MREEEIWPREAGEGRGSCLPGSVSRMLGQSQSLRLIRRFLLLSASLSLSLRALVKGCMFQPGESNVKLLNQSRKGGGRGEKKKGVFILQIF